MLRTVVAAGAGTLHLPASWALSADASYSLAVRVASRNAVRHPPNLRNTPNPQGSVCISITTTSPRCGSYHRRRDPQEQHSYKSAVMFHASQSPIPSVSSFCSRSNKTPSSSQALPYPYPPPFRLSLERPQSLRGAGGHGLHQPRVVPRHARQSQRHHGDVLRPEVAHALPGCLGQHRQRTVGRRLPTTHEKAR